MGLVVALCHLPTGPSVQKTPLCVRWEEREREREGEREKRERERREEKREREREREREEEYIGETVECSGVYSAIWSCVSSLSLAPLSLTLPRYNQETERQIERTTTPFQLSCTAQWLWVNDSQTQRLKTTAQKRRLGLESRVSRGEWRWIWCLSPVAQYPWPDTDWIIHPRDVQHTPNIHNTNQTQLRNSYNFNYKI